MIISVDGATLVLKGAFDVRTTGAVRPVLHELIRGHRSVVVDLSDVPSVDQTALKVLAFASRRALRLGHDVTLRGCTPPVLRMLHLSRLIRLVEVDRHAASLRPIA
ncbi:MAG: anti-sigma factor antagonist [Nocardioides sp.]|jgi:anti-anti-sigma factor|nr:anti-sigma factor antagonist [Nocardioides sp.]